MVGQNFHFVRYEFRFVTYDATHAKYDLNHMTYDELQVKYDEGRVKHDAKRVIHDMSFVMLDARHVIIDARCVMFDVIQVIRDITLVMLERRFGKRELFYFKLYRVSSGFAVVAPFDVFFFQRQSLFAVIFGADGVKRFVFQLFFEKLLRLIDQILGFHFVFN